MFKYFFLTVIIEIPIFFIFFRNRIVFTICILFLANAFSWPLLNLLLHHTNIHLLYLELGVTVVEAIIIRIFLLQDFKKAFFISLLQNSITTAIGIYINNIKI
ncbi:MAG: hypothetical protein IPK18_09425 [Sphingobacteriales bacterium]|jgi:hypothetical protein|nr:MAG: hypothetical protein IPK18_09425 [Sphingobacteriales bacterium]